MNELMLKDILGARDKLESLAESDDAKEIKKALDRDNWFSAEEALEYGLIDKVIHSRSEL